MEERFGNFTLLISKINKNIRKIKNQEMEEHNLKSPHISIIYQLYINEVLTSTNLVEKCDEDKATISRCIDFLEDEGYIFCDSDAIKRYNSPLKLTNKGKKVGLKIYNKINNVLKKLNDVVNEEDRLILYKCLNKISSTLDEINLGKECL